jgi:hypothetical protein
MKTYITFISAILLGIGVLSGQEKKGAVIAVEPEVHELGTMRPQDIPDGKLSFTVHNHGDEPLILTNVRACCGTRVDEYTQTPIAVGDSGIVRISWRIHPRPHRINRTVTIASNASNRQFYVARIRGEVILPEE